ncbi:rubrerythrin [[Clostridium] sordellii]|uniref:Rubrerythrin n=1 Tax=Paraclostridium sordellii TaxID=1505 RepID=A0ABP1XSJ6_PARSO|nr:rubrerythrin family protein [Paeniclostridium sordellii]EPZ54787.1 rubrerythrin family protein [[Clostridium] sordellii ATCC 9714] [Paeniclostridium sordellii ATCC 9714]CEJ74275.1 rubrerythrin [[Clostridium] sordellii] [Paeniclostridium sordellii]CEN69817.1 rubrerythrin [[Clostridium] sordellii] [Paeniclostridium sordellii]CEN73085.1 rubrerythrin [[Clostridium] sordellii] [Paeniclostridium sordellii]CEO25741.1 rubrerythrin [[Clostridium] sordellii] [Paeniclostridium sordellii]
MDLKNSKTAKNLMEAFEGESKAMTKYNFYAEQAKKEGYNKIAKFFEETANNERAHAKIWFKLLNNGIKSTLNNLNEASEGENFEWTDMYYRFAKEAQEEGFDDIAYLFKSIGKIEKQHEERYLELISHIEENTVFKKDEDIKWRCMNCGHIHQGKKALAICPVCSHPKAFFEVSCDCM